MSSTKMIAPATMSGTGERAPVVAGGVDSDGVGVLSLMRSFGAV
jgi:hypothetical protein